MTVPLIVIAAILATQATQLPDTASIELQQLQMAGADTQHVEDARMKLAAYQKNGSAEWGQFESAALLVRQDVITKRLKFVNSAHQQLRQHETLIQNEDVTKWTEGRETATILDRRRWNTATTAIRTAADKVNEKSKVHFHTKHTGAQVLYQTLDEFEHHGNPMTVPQLTDCDTTLTPAAYYIWTERDGKRTSMIREYDIIDAKMKIDLEETK